MIEESPSSGSFGPHPRRSHRPRRGPRRPPKPAIAKATENPPAIPALTTGDTSDSTEGVAEIRESVGGLKGPSEKPVLTPVSGIGSEGAPATGQSPPPRLEHSDPRQRGRSQERPRQSPQPPLPPRRQNPRTLQQASQEVLGIIERLNDVLCDMEQVLKMLDDVEIQQRSDEKEIESLRNALRQFQNPPRPQQQRSADRDRGPGGRQPHFHDRRREQGPQHRPPPPSEPGTPQPPPQAEKEPLSPQPRSALEEPDAD